jgi:hypothetical protein
MLAREIFYSLKEAQVLIEMWRTQYNTVRPHSALGYRPPGPRRICHPTCSDPTGWTNLESGTKNGGRSNNPPMKNQLHQLNLLEFEKR